MTWGTNGRGQNIDLLPSKGRHTTLERKRSRDSRPCFFFRLATLSQAFFYFLLWMIIPKFSPKACSKFCSSLHGNCLISRMGLFMQAWGSREKRLPLPYHSYLEGSNARSNQYQLPYPYRTLFPSGPNSSPWDRMGLWVLWVLLWIRMLSRRRRELSHVWTRNGHRVCCHSIAIKIPFLLIYPFLSFRTSRALNTSNGQKDRCSDKEQSVRISSSRGHSYTYTKHPNCSSILTSLIYL